MKRIAILLLLVFLVSLIPASAAFAGNGAPSGAHYNLNIIGVQNQKDNLSGGSGNVIFVPLWGNGTKIMLTEGPFDVIDKNGTDGEAAFQLPNPDENNTGTTTYSVFARALGKPTGKAYMSTCATVVETGEVYCPIETSGAVLELKRSPGGKASNQFQNVSKYLLYVWIDLDGDGQLEHYNLFNDALQDYFWSYDNQGLKLAQLRFYECPTTVGDTINDPISSACGLTGSGSNR